MTTMRGDIVNRVKRLPKPAQAAEALQPVFEAVSNSLHAVEDAFGDDYQAHGQITVTIVAPRSPPDLEIIVSDNGVGLGPERFDAFCTTDTDHKISRGGKGVGRLLRPYVASTTDRWFLRGARAPILAADCFWP